MEPNELFDLSGKVAIITGGAGSIGVVYGRALCEVGASVVLADVDAGAAERDAAGLVGDGHQAIGVAVDVTGAQRVGLHGEVDQACVVLVPRPLPFRWVAYVDEETDLQRHENSLARRSPISCTSSGPSASCHGTLTGRGTSYASSIEKCVPACVAASSSNIARQIGTASASRLTRSPGPGNSSP